MTYSRQIRIGLVLVCVEGILLATVPRVAIPLSLVLIFVISFAASRFGLRRRSVSVTPQCGRRRDQQFDGVSRLMALLALVGVAGIVASVVVGFLHIEHLAVGAVVAASSALTYLGATALALVGRRRCLDGDLSLPPTLAAMSTMSAAVASVVLAIAAHTG